MQDIYYDQILKRIESAGRGSLFVIPDFVDIASRQVIRQSLLRMEERNILKRVIRGIYEYPLFNDFLNEFVAPSPNLVAETIARMNQWAVVPYGDTILNLMKLSTQVPAQWIYISSGPYKTYRYDHAVIKFHHTASRDIINMGRKTLEIIQVLKALGKDHLDSALLAKIGNSLTPDEKKLILSETKYSTQWIHEAIKTICSSKGKIHERDSEAVLV